MIDLKRFRQENNIKQLDIARLLDIPQSYVSQIEKGTRPLNLDKYNSLFREYGNIINNYRHPDTIPFHTTAKGDSQQVEDPTTSYKTECKNCKELKLEIKRLEGLLVEKDKRIDSLENALELIKQFSNTNVKREK